MLTADGQAFLAAEGDTFWSGVGSWFRDYGIQIGVTLILALLIRWILVRVIKRVTRDTIRRARKERPGLLRNSEHTAELTSVLMNQRREQRATAMGQLLRSATTFVVLFVTVLLILTEIGFNIAPLLASAGVLGVALGFGAQTLVKDFLSGIFLVVEDQFGVGDVVDLGPAIGTVEEVGLRITRVRDTSGVVWYVRNGEILRVGNRSQGWTMAVVDLAIPYDVDLERVRRLVEQVGADMDADPEYDTVLFGTPSYSGVESVQGEYVHVRVAAKAAPDQQAEAGRAMREQLKLTFDRAGIELPQIMSVAGPSSLNPAATPQTPKV